MHGLGKQIYVLLTIGIILSAVSTFFYQKNLEAITTDNQSGWYITLGLVADIFISFGAVLSFFSYSRSFPSYIKFCYITLVLLVIIVSLGDIDKMMVNPSIFYSTKGIGTYINIGILFFAADKVYLNKLLKLFYILCFVFLISGFINMSAIGIASGRDQLLFAIREFTVYLIWVFPFFFFQNFTNKQYNLVNYIVFLLMLILVISTGSRGYLILYFLISVIKVYGQSRKSKTAAVTTMIGVVTLVVGLYIFIINSDLYKTIDSAVSIFTDRVSDDSRSGQLIEFFNQFDISYLISGVGPVKTWNWSGSRVPYGFLDNQYILITWWAGLPAGIVYTMFIFICFLKRTNVKSNIVTAGKLTVFLWILACAGLAIYVAISSTLYYYFISLTMGIIALRQVAVPKQTSNS